MTKIVMPFLMNDENDLDSPRVSGGLERFSQFIYKYASAEVIPFYYNREDRKNRTVTPKLISFIHNHKPDLVISNQDSGTITTNIQNVVDIPMLWISHTAAGGIFKIPQLDMMKEFVDNGGTLAMVSQWQYDGMNELSKRVRSRELELNGGLINSAFCTGDEQTSTQIDYDCVTIGRVDKEKDPFLLHKLAGKSDLKSLVLTSAYDLIPSQQEYLDKNKHWEGNRETKFNLKHSEVMDHLSRSGVYLSTCARETWGITALEAFARGVPVVLFRLAANKNKHASEDIAPGPEYFEAITSKSEKDFKLAVDKLLKVDRMELSQKTKEKHSKENWVKTLNNLIDKAIENKKQHQKPVSWFD
jgi:glycosyltransferase involved in cell wall biosynthesis